MLAEAEVLFAGRVRHQQLDVIVRQQRRQPARHSGQEPLGSAGITIGLGDRFQQSGDSFLLPGG
jgi:hypothetical protein